MIRIVASFAVLLVMVSAGAVYNLKEATERLEERKRDLASRILEDKAAIKVLRAEMAYLSRPDRLQRLSERFLALKSTEYLQVVSSLDQVAGRGEVRTASLPVDNFRLLLPQSKPEKVPDKYRRAPVRMVEQPGVIQARAEKPEEPAPRKNLFERILVKLDKNQ
ncbi:cell division protein FtsL [Emcibacter sp.]|uniref:cell division protein FtsL n=1 Tax=Emcibacter sp. TaxID=1979954 RepID=UPI003A8F849F